MYGLYGNMWLRNCLDLGTKWYGIGKKWHEFWVRNGLPGV